MQEINFDSVDKKLLVAGGKIIHQIWFDFKNPRNVDDSKNPIPEKYQKLRDTWIVNNPDWMHVVWNDVMGDWLVYKHYRIFWEIYSRYPYPVQRVDTVRLCLLHRYGGLYADMDMQCLKSINPVIDSMTHDIGIVKHTKLFIVFNIFNVSNFLMYSKPGKDFWYNALFEMMSIGMGKSYLTISLKILYSTGPGALSKVVKAHKDEVQIFGPDVFPSRTTGTGLNAIPDSAYATHISAVEWRKGSAKLSEDMIVLFILLIIFVIVGAFIRQIAKNRNFNIDIGVHS
jgi:inositol phosphorylceramide mannosyltransferase catalytic subunit